MAERESGQPESVEGSGPFERADGATSFLQRAVIRRRVRFLRRRRELALHDLGGFLFESHRLGQPREDLLADKLAALTALEQPLADYHLFYATRADMLERTGGDPRPDLKTAISLATNCSPTSSRR